MALTAVSIYDIIETSYWNWNSICMGFFSLCLKKLLFTNTRKGRWALIRERPWLIKCTLAKFFQFIFEKYLVNLKADY